MDHDQDIQHVKLRHGYHLSILLCLWSSGVTFFGVKIAIFPNEVWGLDVDRPFQIGPKTRSGTIKGPHSFFIFKFYKSYSLPKSSSHTFGVDVWNAERPNLWRCLWVQSPTQKAFGRLETSSFIFSPTIRHHIYFLGRDLFSRKKNPAKKDVPPLCPGHQKHISCSKPKECWGMLKRPNRINQLQGGPPTSYK